MQEKITKGIIAAGYNNDGAFWPIEDKAVAQYEKEVVSGYDFPSHVFLRDTDRHRVTKSNFLIAGIPMIWYGMQNTSRTDLERISVVGDEVTGANVELFSGFIEDSRFEYCFEGPPDEWKASGTFRKGFRSVGAEDEMALILMGDVPLITSLDGVVSDPDVGNYDAVFDLNSRTRTNRHWPRRYHAKLLHKGRPLYIKEPNLLLGNVDKFDEVTAKLGLSNHLIDMVYSGRKAHGSKKGSRRESFEELFANDGRWWTTLKGIGPIYALQLWNSKRRGNPPLILPRKAYDAVNDSLGLKVLFKADNHDPGTLEDIDGLADWAFTWDMLERAGDSIYPDFSSLKSHAANLVPELRREIEFYRNFEEYMNSLFKGYGLLEPFVGGRGFRNPFTVGNNDTSEKAEGIITRSVRRHRSFIRRRNLLDRLR